MAELNNEGVAWISKDGVLSGVIVDKTLHLNPLSQSMLAIINLGRLEGDGA